MFLVPSGPPSNVMTYILNETSIKVNWIMSSQTNGYVIVINSTIRVKWTCPRSEDGNYVTYYLVLKNHHRM